MSTLVDGDELGRRLKPMYEKMVKIWPRKGDNDPPVPSLDACVLAHRYQESWAPPMDEGNNGRINLLVLGESHLSTDSNILGIGIDAENTTEVPLPQLGHLNLVHCPTYGELDLLPEKTVEALSKSTLNTLRAGTWQFWRVLMVLSGLADDYFTNKDDTELKQVFRKLHKLNVTVDERLALKGKIKRCLINRRIMFADVCPAPIAVGGANTIKVPNKITGIPYTTKKVILAESDKRAIISVAWNEYSSHLVKKYKPRFVLVLGLSVLSAVGEESLKRVLDDFDGVFLGDMYHPSCNHVKSNECSRIMLLYLQQVSFFTTKIGSYIQDPAFPSIQKTRASIVAHRNGKKFDNRKIMSAKKMKDLKQPSQKKCCPKMQQQGMELLVVATKQSRRPIKSESIVEASLSAGLQEQAYIAPATWDTQVTRDTDGESAQPGPEVQQQGTELYVAAMKDRGRLRKNESKAESSVRNLEKTASVAIVCAVKRF